MLEPARVGRHESAVGLAYEGLRLGDTREIQWLVRTRRTMDAGGASFELGDSHLHGSIMRNLQANWTQPYPITWVFPVTKRTTDRVYTLYEHRLLLQAPRPELMLRARETTIETAPERTLACLYTAPRIQRAHGTRGAGSLVVGECIDCEASTTALRDKLRAWPR